LLRADAVFAAAPLLVYLFAPNSLGRPLRFIVLISTIVILLLVGAKIMNTHVFNATATNPLMSLKLFDVAGIIHYSRDPGVLSERDANALSVTDSCYSPIQWDDINRGICEKLYRSPEPTNRQWVAGVLKHPVAYGRHRLAHWNEALFLFRPVRSFDWDAHGYRGIFPPAPAENEIKHALEFLSNFPLFSPGIPLIACIGVMIFALRTPEHVLADRSLTASVFLATSAVAHASGWLIVGVASMYRYQQHNMTAGWLAAALFLMASAKGSARHTRSKRWLVLASAAALVGIAAARLLLIG
jgi:hypothetical protein